MLAATYVAQNVFFAMLAAVMIYGAIRVVTTNNVVHAALWLVVVLSGAAGNYVLLGADFVASTQVLVYVGAIVVLLLFGTMLTRTKVGAEGELTSKQWPVAALVSLMLLGVMGGVLLDAFGDEKLPAGDAATVVKGSAPNISDSIFGTYLLPFWALSFVLLAALVGAIVLARRD
jgi:NADH-quinone oxidoreductase subunit J